MIYITGDCHGDFRKFSTSNFPDQKGMTRDDFVIVCGDFGIWSDDASERWWLGWLEEKPFTILFVDGNHENFDRLYGQEFPLVNFHGGKAHKIRENIFHLMRGYVFELEGSKFFAFGGARSHDISDGILEADDLHRIIEMRKARKMFRINHVSWWKEEMPDEIEMRFGENTLSEYNNKVDYIITHCCPQDVAALCGYPDGDELTNWFMELSNKIEFKKWFFGHYHDDKQVLGKYEMMYWKVVRII